MKSNQKKKPRQRNRPRNKANCLKLSETDHEEVKENIKKKENSFVTFVVNVKEECINYDDTPELIDTNVISQVNLENRSIEGSLYYQNADELFENTQCKLLLSKENLLKEQIVEHNENVLKKKLRESKKNAKNEIDEGSDDTDDLPELIDERFENIDVEEKYENIEKIHLANENITQKDKQAYEETETHAVTDQSILLNRNQKKTKHDLIKLELKGQQQQQKQNSKKHKLGLTNRSHKCQEENNFTRQKVEESTLKKLTFEKNTSNTIAESTSISKEIKSNKCNLEVVDFTKKQKHNSMPDNEKAVKNSYDTAQRSDVNEKNAFIQNLQQQMEAMMAKGNNELPTTLMENLQKLFNQTPVNGIETSDEEDEYVEYIYKPRKYFLISLCNFCKADLSSGQETMPCSRCHLTYYCCREHMKKDSDHQQLCYALKKLSGNNGGRHLFYKCSDFTPEQFRSYRIVTIKQLEKYINRPLTPSEQEIILFARLCLNNQCREYRFDKLINCQKCGMVAYCIEKEKDHCQMAESAATHQYWCQAYRLFKQFIIYQEKFGRLEPSMPTKVLKEFPVLCTSTKDIFKKLNLDLPEADCEYAALTQISTVPLTAWYALKVCDKLKDQTTLTIHLVGAEIEFEVDLLHKWELFFLHIAPTLQKLNVIFIGPELDPKNISFDQLSKTKCCRLCRKSERSVTYRFVTQIYHDYCKMEEFSKPHLICFFNAGLYRCSGYNMEDTWPATIYAATQLNVPVVVSAYTEYEMPLDMQRFVQESSRYVNVIMPPHSNPFKSTKPERNFISDDVAPLMFKNYYCFVVE